MNNLNSVLIDGNLTKDPETKQTAAGTTLTKLSIATNKSYKSGDEYKKEVSYFDIDVWGKTAEFCSKYLSKGMTARIIGTLKQDRWENEQGQKRSKVKIVAERVEFVFKKKDETTAYQQPEKQKDFQDDIPF